MIMIHFKGDRVAETRPNPTWRAGIFRSSPALGSNGQQCALDETHKPAVLSPINFPKLPNSPSLTGAWPLPIEDRLNSLDALRMSWLEHLKVTRHVGGKVRLAGREVCRDCPAQ